MKVGTASLVNPAQRRESAMKSLSYFDYYTEEDVEPICNMCKNAYYGDWSIQDCDYCIITKLLHDIKEFAEELDHYYSSGL